MISVDGAGPRRWAAAVRSVAPRTILAIGFALFLLYAYPGYMSTDSVAQLFEARTGHFTDPHPPIMAAQWKLLDLIVSGPILMLLLQGGLLLGGLFNLLRRAMAPRAAALVAVAILLFPPVVTTMAVIWKDSQMAGYVVMGTSLLLGERRRTRLIGLGLITLGCAFRYNGFAATVPIVGMLFVWRPGLRWWKRYLISGAAAVASVVVALGTDYALASEHSNLSPAVIDIVGVLNYTRDRTDDDLNYVLRGTPLRVHTGIQAKIFARYSARNPYYIDHGPDRLFDAPKDDAERAAMTRAWREIVSSDWHAYLEHRLAGFEELLGLSDDGLFSPVYTAFVEAPAQAIRVSHDASPSWLQQRLVEQLNSFANDGPMFLPYLYAAIALAILILCCRDRVTFAILVSGLLYELSFAMAGGTPDFRYSHWMITCTCLATTLLFVQRLRGRRLEGTLT